MIKDIREKFNLSFSELLYSQVIDRVNRDFGKQVPFHIAESPVFVPPQLGKKILDAGRFVCSHLLDPSSLESTTAIVPPILRDSCNSKFPECLAIDFGVIENEQGELDCQLIELQGAMSLFGFTDILATAYQEIYGLHGNYTPYLSGLNAGPYNMLLKRCLVGNHDPENVVLLDIYPAKQQNQIDFYAIQTKLSIPTICISDMHFEDDKIFYFLGGRRIRIERIINRVLIEELNSYPELSACFSFEKHYEVEYINHPAWFYRVSKYIMPSLKGPNFPHCMQLEEAVIKELDLSRYVLKPIFSFGGHGIELNPSKQMVEELKNKTNYILQERVKYASCISTPKGNVKLEIRLLLLWDADISNYVPVITLARLSKGPFMALSCNKDAWIGASVCLFELD